SLGLEVAPAWRRQHHLVPGREDELAFLPGFGMDDQREPPPTVALKERFKPAVMVGVAVRNDKRTQLPDRNLQNVQIASKSGRRQTAVVQDRPQSALRLDCDQRGKAMFCDQLVATAEVARKVSADIV